VRGGTPPRPAPPLSLFDFPLGLALLQQTQSYDPAEFEALAAAYEGLAWRVVSKPGGATVKPDELYTLYSYHMQARNILCVDTEPAFNNTVVVYSIETLQQQL
jgi:hypothetical protein